MDKGNCDVSETNGIPKEILDIAGLYGYKLTKEYNVVRGFVFTFVKNDHIITYGVHGSAERWFKTATEIEHQMKNGQVNYADNFQRIYD